MAALAVFALIVVVSLLAPFYARHVAHENPFLTNVNGTTIVNGKRVPVLQQSSGPLHLGETPIAPTWDVHHYFLGADGYGRDVAALTLYGGRTSLEIGLASAAVCCGVGTHIRAHLRLLRRRDRLAVLSRVRPDLGDARLHAGDFNRDRPYHRPPRPSTRPDQHNGRESLAADPPNRVHLHPVRLSPDTRGRARQSGRESSSTQQSARAPATLD